MAASLAGVLRPVVLLILFCRFYNRDFEILTENRLADVSEFILAKNWVKNECYFTKFEFGISKLAGTGSPLRYVNKRITKIQRCERTFSLMFLLLSCGDVSLNPGPINYKYPCGVCAKAVRKNQNGIYCDGCNLWHHIKCLDMSIDTFRELGNSENLDWYCQKCTIPQFSDSFFENSRNSSFGNLDSVSDSGSLPDTEKAYIREL